MRLGADPRHVWGALNPEPDLDMEDRTGPLCRFSGKRVLARPGVEQEEHEREPAAPALPSSLPSRQTDVLAPVSGVLSSALVGNDLGAPRSQLGAPERLL